MEGKGNTGTDEEMLEELQHESINYFFQNVNTKNGLVADSTDPDSPTSIAVVGLALSCYIVADKEGYLTRPEAAKRTLTTLRFFRDSPQGTGKYDTGYKGFYYHFLHMETGQRVWESELSTIDTALFIAGALTSRCYFTEQNDIETEIREIADDLYRRIDWQWALNGGSTLSHGWKPESGFINYHWNTGYSEAMILYILAMGSPTYPISETGYNEWLSTFEWKSLYGIHHLYAAPLFIHQLSHLWIDFRGIHDNFNRKVGIDYFENSRRATQVQQRYAIANPLGYKGYGKNCWGLSASDGPGPATFTVDGKEHVFYNYIARGINWTDDGTVSPWAMAAALPFAPEIVIESLRYGIENLNIMNGSNGLHASFNPTFPDTGSNKNGWVSSLQYGLNQGPVVLMLANHKADLIWNVSKACPYFIKGLLRAGFGGGWLDGKKDNNE
jgi:hypothetical protein